METGRVYPDFERQENFTHQTLADFPYLPVHIGVDFNVGKMHTTVAVVKDYKPLILDEIVGCRDTQALIAEIKRRYPQRAIYIYPDASGRHNSSNASSSDVAQLENAGFQVFAKRSNPAVRNRIASVNGQICNGKNERKLLINIQKCPQLVKSLEQQTYKDGRPEESNDLDHSVDALGYFCYWNWAINKNAVSTDGSEPR